MWCLWNWKHSQFWQKNPGSLSWLVGQPADARNSLQFPRSLYSPPFLPTFTPDVPFWPPSSRQEYVLSFLDTSQKKMPNYKEWDVTQFNSASKFKYAFGVKINYSKKSILNRPHISLASTGKYDTCIVVTCLIFHQRLRGRQLAPP